MRPALAINSTAKLRLFQRRNRCALTGHGREHHGQILTEAAALAERGRLVPRLHSSTFTLDDVESAYATVEDGSATGRVVVLPNA